MQVVVASLAQGFREILFVNFLDSWVFMGLPQLFPLILGVDGFNSLVADFIGCKAGLAASTDTTARTGHYLNKVVLRLAGFYTVEKLACIAEAVGNGGAQLYPVKEGPLFQRLLDGKGRLFYPFKPHDSADMKVFEGELSTGYNFVGGT